MSDSRRERGWSGKRALKSLRGTERTSPGASCRRLPLHLAESAADLARFIAGSNGDAKIEMTAITTRSSIRVKADAPFPSCCKPHFSQRASAPQLPSLLDMDYLRP